MFSLLIFGETIPERRYYGDLSSLKSKKADDPFQLYYTHLMSTNVLSENENLWMQLSHFWSYTLSRFFSIFLGIPCIKCSSIFMITPNLNNQCSGSHDIVWGQSCNTSAFTFLRCTYSCLILFMIFFSVAVHHRGYGRSSTTSILLLVLPTWIIPNDRPICTSPRS